MAPQVVRLYNQMPEPKYVIAMGPAPFRAAFSNKEYVLKGIDRYTLGCIFLAARPAPKH
jgi:NADH-quinone oxidoreductase subunit B